MNWLPDLTARIRAAGCPPVQTDALVLCADALAALCEQFVSKAPMPHLEMWPPDEEYADSDLKLSWTNVRLERSLTIYAESDGSVWLHLQDSSGQVASRTVLAPTGDQLRVAVTTFFDGWTP